MEPGNSQRRLPTQFMLLAKALIGGYLIYMAWQLFQNILGGKESQPVFLGCFLILFAIAGAGIMVSSLKDLLQGRYAGGRLDVIPDEEEKGEILQETSLETEEQSE